MAWVFPAELRVDDEVLCPGGDCNTWVHVDQIGSGNGELLIACADHEIVHLPATTRVQVRRRSISDTSAAWAGDDPAQAAADGSEDVEARMPSWYPGDLAAARAAHDDHAAVAAASADDHPLTVIEIEEHLHAWYGGDLEAVRR